MPELARNPITPRTTRIRPRFGLRTTLFGLVLLALVPVVLHETYAVYNRFERRAVVELESNQRLAEVAAATFANYLDNLWNTQLAIGLAITSHLPVSEIEPYMTAQLKAHPTVDTFSWVDPSGIVLAATRASARGISCADRDHIKTILAGANQSISSLYISKVNKRPSIYVARAIRVDGQLRGIVVAAILPDKLGLVFSERPGRGSLGLVDANGMLVYRGGDGDQSYGQRRISPSSPVWRALKQGVTVVRRNYASVVDGRHRMGVWVPIPGIGWAASATTPVDVAFAVARSDTRQDAIVLVLVILASVLATVLVSESIMRRVRALERAALDLTSGDLTARARLKGSDELAVAGLAFDAMADRIQGLDTERTQFLQTAAHELRNPMASVTGLLSLMLKRMNEGRRLENQADLMEVMKREVLRLSTLLNEMLEAFRVQEGQLPLKWRPVGLFEVITSAIEPFRLIASSHEFRLTVAEGAEVTVLGDKRRLEDLVRNLLSNAVKYSPEGGEIEVALDVTDECGRISVSDHGIGVPADQLARIFERFYRATNLSGRDPGGMGLGLYICRDIALAHGGRIWAESTPENGTTIHVEIPRYERRSR